MNIHRTLLVLFAAALAACGAGSGGISGSGGVPTGTSRGPIDGFGSVIVNGVAFDSDSAQILKDGLPATQDDLAVGQLIEVAGDFEQRVATTISYRSEVKGPVTSVVISDPDLGLASVVVLGQTVRVNADTVLNGVSLQTLAPGDLLEVSGARAQGGTVFATYLELKATLDTYKVVGTVEASAPTSFRIGGLLLDTASADLTDMPGGVVTDGQRVEAKGAPAGWNAAVPSLAASKVEPAAVGTGAAGQRLELEGYITDFASPEDFRVLGSPVRTTASTVFQNGTSASLTNNVKVQVKGSLDSEGVLVAASCEIQSTGAHRTTWTIEATDVQSQAVRVLGVDWSIRGETELDDNSSANQDPLTFADLLVGDYVRVRGYRDGSELVAERLRRRDPESEARLRGPVTAVEGLGAVEVEILQQQVFWDTSTKFYDENDQQISESQFLDGLFLGRFVDAKWNSFFGDLMTEPADELSLEVD
jgi:hypothetical protein